MTKQVIFGAISGAVSGFIVGGVYGAIVGAVLGAALAGLQVALAGKPPKPPDANAFTVEAQERTTIIRSAIQPRRLAYGEVVTSGTLDFFETSDAGGGEEFAHAVITFLDHQVHEISDIYIDGDQLGERDGDGNVITGDYANLARIKVLLGYDDQTADPDLTSETGASSTDRWQGMAAVYIRLKSDATQFPFGFPNSIRARIKGKLVFDPRDTAVAISETMLDTAGVATFKTASAHGLSARDRVWVQDYDGAVLASHDPRRTTVSKEYQVSAVPAADEFTLVGWDGEELALTTAGSGGTVTKMKWSPNWALAVRDFITGEWGVNADDDEISDDHITAAANVSDEDVPLSGNETDVIQLTETAPNTFSHTEASALRANTGDRVRFSTTDTLPGGLATDTDYYYFRAFAGEDNADENWAVATSRQNAFDKVAVDITDAGTGTHSVSREGHARYECHGLIDSTEIPGNVLEDLLIAGYGALDWTQGLYRLHVGAWFEPTLTLEEKDVAGTLIDDPRVPRADVYNYVKVSYIEPFNAFRVTEVNAPSHADWEIDDGGQRIVREVQLVFVQDHIRAQRIGNMIAQDSRHQESLEVPVFLKNWANATVWSNVSVTLPDHDLNADTYRVMEYRRSLPGISTVKLKRVDPIVYTWTSDLEKSAFASVGGTFELTIPATQDLDLKQYIIDNSNWSGTTPGATFNITIAGKITASSTSAKALLIEAFPANSTVNLTINAEVVGRGGSGGGSGIAGSPGGTTMKADPQPPGSTVTIFLNDEINAPGGGGGGGGQGGNSGELTVGCSCTGTRATGGTGSSGYGPSAPAPGGAGDFIAGECNGWSSTGGSGGQGGTIDTAGASGNTGTAICNSGTAGAGGGAKGVAINGVSNVTIHTSTAGVVNGDQIN